MPEKSLDGAEPHVHSAGTGDSQHLKVKQRGFPFGIADDSRKRGSPVEKYFDRLTEPRVYREESNRQCALFRTTTRR